MQLAIYISGNRLDLFDDEAVNFIAKATDLNDISKIFMDFSQTFSVPASRLNNFVFQHYYDSDIDGTFNANIRIPALIEIDTIPFKSGKIQLEEVKMDRNQPELYKITFYGDLKELSDTFGDDKLRDLGRLSTSSGGTASMIYNDNPMLSKFDHPFDEANVSIAMSYPFWAPEGTVIGGDVMYPLISSQRVWRIGTGTAVDPTVTNKRMDITQNEGSIVYNELKPGLRIDNIIKAIEYKYNVSFSRQFFDRAAFQQLYMWLSNTSDAMKSYGDPIQADFPTTTANTASNSSVNAVTNVVTVTNQPSITYVVSFRVTPITGGNIPYMVGMLINEGTSRQKMIWSNELTGESNFAYTIPPTDASPNTFKFYVKSASKMTYDGKAVVIGPPVISAGRPYRPAGIFSANSATSNGRVRIVEQLPDIKVIDFLSGIIKMFNLVIRAESNNSFYITTMDDFYAGGDIHDITQYVNIDDTVVSRPILKKVINFKFQKTDNILGKNFRNTYGGIDEVGYGDLRATYPVDSGEELKIELPFENMLFENLVNQNPATTGETFATNVVTGSAFNIDYNSNKVKPILFYNNGVMLLEKPIRFDNGSGGSTPLNNVYLIGNENHIYSDQITQTINFNSEVSPWTQVVQPQSLYNNFWSRYIGNIYNLKQRKYTYSAILPLSILLKISLDDRLNIADKQYRINDYQVNILEGTTKLNLVNNYYDQPFQGETEGIDRLSYYSNGGIGYFDIVITTNSTWTLNKVFIGGIPVTTDWVIVSQTSGVGTSRITVKTTYNGNPTANTGDRSVRLDFNTNGHTYMCYVTQQGIIY